MTRDQAETDRAGNRRIRLFLALPMPEPVRGQFADLIGRLRKGTQFSTCRPSWVKPELIHLTLLFLGATEPARLPSIASAARSAAARFSPLRLEVKRLGVFPGWRGPKVLWTGVRDRTHQLLDLHGSLTRALEPLGYEPEAREYHPHLTLARIKSLKGVDALRPVVESHQEFFCGPFDVEELVLFQSRLEAGGAVHTALERFPLSARRKEKPKENRS